MSSTRFATMVLIPIVALLMSAWPCGASATEKLLTVNDCSYGDTYQFAPAACTATIENTGSTPLSLSITAVQPGNTVAPHVLTLAPHARADLSLHVMTENIAGAITWTYRVDGAQREPYFVHASGFVSSVLDDSHPEINFGAIDPAALPTTRTIALTSSLNPNIRITQVLYSPPMLRSLMSADGKSLLVEMGPDAPWGSIDGFVKLAVSDSRQKQVWVHVTASLAGDVAPLESPHWVGELVWHPNNVLTVPLFASTRREFSIGKVTSEDFQGTYDSADCVPARSGCRNLLIHVSESQTTGLFKAHLDVELPDRKRHLMVSIWGVLGERPKPGQEAMPPEIKKVPIPRLLGDDGVTAIPSLKVQADPSGTGPLLKWTIGQQQSVHGYQVLRSSSASGPFELMEPQVITTLDNGKGPVAYRWRDVTATKGETYWYYVVVLYSSGDRRPLSTPQMTVAK